MTDSPVRFDVPESAHAVFSNDGRVFIDASYLVSEFEPRIETRERMAALMGNEEDKGYVKGERNLIDAIAATRDAMLIDANL